MMMQFRLIASLLAVQSILAFVPSPLRRGGVAVAPSVLASEPSDTSSDYFDDIVEIESSEYEPTTEEATVTNLMDLMPASSVAALGDLSSETRSAINEALYKLEALNPTSTDPAVSPLLNGVWELRYSGGYTPEGALPSPTRQFALFLYSGGYSPALFALGLAQKLPFVEIQDVEIAISRSQPRVQATVKFQIPGGSSVTSQVLARLEPVSARRLTETYESAVVMDRNVALPQPLQYTRDLYVTYVDADLLVVRDGTGVPEVLVRKDKVFSQNWGTEPSEVTMDDTTVPE